MRNKIIAGAVAGVMALNVAGAAAFADREDRNMPEAPQPQMSEQGFFGTPFGGPGGKGGGKGAEKAWEMEYLVENAGIPLGEAEDIARGESPGRVMESKLDDEDGYPVYEVEVLAEDGYVYEYKLDANNGNIYEREIEGA